MPATDPFAEILLGKRTEAHDKVPEAIREAVRTAVRTVIEDYLVELQGYNLLLGRMGHSPVEPLYTLDDVVDFNIIENDGSGVLFRNSPPAKTPERVVVHDKVQVTDRLAATLKRSEAPPTREYIRQALHLNGGPMRMVDVVNKVHELGSEAADDTVRGVLQKMLHAEQVARVDRGTYLLVDGPEGVIYPEELARKDLLEEWGEPNAAKDAYPNPAYRGSAPSNEGTRDTTID